MALKPVGNQESITTSGSSAKSGAIDQKTKYLRVVAISNDAYIEVGTEEQKEGLNQYQEVEYNIQSITRFCNENKYDSPIFYVVQNGSKVKEVENTGIFQDLDLENYEKDSSIK